MGKEDGTKETPSSTTGPSERKSGQRTATKSKAHTKSSSKTGEHSNTNTSAAVSSSSNSVELPKDAKEILEVCDEDGEKAYILEGRLPLSTSFWKALDTLRQKRPVNEVNNISYEIVLTTYGFIQYRNTTKVSTWQPQAPKSENILIPCGRDGCEFNTTSKSLWEAHTANNHSAICRYIFHCKLCKFKCLIPTTFYRHERDKNHVVSVNLAAKCARSVYLEQQARKAGTSITETTEPELPEFCTQRERPVEKQPPLTKDSVESKASHSDVKSSKDKKEAKSKFFKKHDTQRTSSIKQVTLHKSSNDTQRKKRSANEPCPVVDSADESPDEWKPPVKRSRKTPAAYPRRTTRSSNTKGRPSSPPPPPVPELRHREVDSDDDTTSSSSDNGDSSSASTSSDEDVTPSTSYSPPSPKCPTPPPVAATSSKRLKTTARKSTVNKSYIKQKFQEKREQEKEKEKKATPPTKTLDDIDSESLYDELKRRKIIYPCQCGLLFSNISSFYLHVGCHNRNNPKICNYCLYEAQNWMDFHSHFFNHSSQTSE